MAAETDNPRNADEETQTVIATVPAQVGEYQIIRRIGGGGMGVVYEALHSRLKRRVALKMLSEAMADRPSASRRFFREMEVIGKLDHPHIVRATDAGQSHGTPYLVMEFVDGADLSQVVRKHGPLPPLAALDVIQQAAEALGHIHLLGLIHRDIKPSNLLLDKRGVVKVADLGLAQFQAPEPGSEELSGLGAVIGTVDYMSPEQADPAHPIDPRADLYSLGCCLYFLLCGKPIFKAATQLDRIIAHRTSAPPDLVTCRGIRVPESLSRLFHDLVAKNPDQRPQSTGVTIERIQECRAHLRETIRSTRQGELFSVGEQPLPLEAGITDVARAVFDESNAMAGFPQTTIRSADEIQVAPQTASTDRRRIAGAAVILIVALALTWWFSGPGQSTSSVSDDGASMPLPAQNSAQRADDRIAPEYPIVLQGHQNAVFCARFSDDGGSILSASADGTVRVWDIAARRQVHVLEGQENLMINVVQIPGTDLAAAACYDGCLYFWNWHTGELLCRPNEHSLRTESVAWIGGTRVLSSGCDDSLLIWEAKTGKVEFRLQNVHQGGVRALAVSPDGGQAVTGDYQGNLYRWDLDRKHALGSIHIDDSAISVWSLDWSRNSNLIAIAGSYANREPLLLTYDLESQRVVNRFLGHNRRVNAVKFSRDGKLLYSAGDFVRIWSLAEATPLYKIGGHAGEIFSIDESPDGTLLVSGGSDAAIRVSQVPSAK